MIEVPIWLFVLIMFCLIGAAIQLYIGRKLATDLEKDFFEISADRDKWRKGYTEMFMKSLDK